MGRGEDEEKGWFLIGDSDNKDLENKVIIFKAKDLKDWFSDFDRWWLQIKDNEVCLSHEGYSYEPYCFGKIKYKGDVDIK